MNMAWEVEIKAHVKDAQGIETALGARYGRGVPFDKRDVYFESVANPGSTAFRLRNDGAGDGLPGPDVVTIKQKGMRDGVEVNNEVEFTVDSADAFHAFAQSLGYRVAIEKRKRGHVWEVESGVHIELAEVSGLGWFVEIEALLDGQGEIPAAEAQVRSLLQSLGVAETDIEPRYYTSLLRLLKAGSGLEAHQGNADGRKR